LVAFEIMMVIVQIFSLDMKGLENVVLAQSVNLCAIIIISGFIVGKNYSIFFGATSLVDITLITIFSKNEVLLKFLVSMLGPIFVVTIATYYIVGLLTGLLKRAIDESENNKKTLLKLKEVLSNITLLKNKLDESQENVYEKLIEIDNIINNYSDRAVKLLNVANNVQSSLNFTEKDLERLIKSTDTISQKITSQTKYVEENSKAQEEVFNSIKTINTSSKTASAINQELSESAREGEESIKGAMESFIELDKYQSQMVEITGVITSISSQTNLLAMNANIEAAHAGTLGRGFGVVANEIRKLADESGIKTKEISNIIKSMNNQISTSKNNMQQVREKLLDITEKVSKVYPLVAEISGSMEQQYKVNNDILSITRELLLITTIIKNSTLEGKDITNSYNMTFKQLKDDINDIISIIN